MRIQFLKLAYGNRYAKVPSAPPDPIVGITNTFQGDTNPRKVNLSVGSYQDDFAKPHVFKAVRDAQEEIFNDQTLNKEYLPIEGLSGFNQAARRLIFGEDSELVKKGRVVTVQTLSGTGSLRLGFQFIAQQIPSTVLISNPTWAIHQSIILRSGLKFTPYPYYDPTTKQARIDEWIAFLNKAQEGNIVLMHACAHNPTGVDPSLNDWKRVAEVMRSRKLLAYFDCAYQGFVTGDIEKDITPVRYFADNGVDTLVSQSFAKILGLYGERVGALHILTENKQTSARVLSQLKMLIRANYSSPPLHGARVAEKVLNNPIYFEAWKKELTEVAQRITRMRKMLRSRLEEGGSEDWRHITEQVGMFSFTGLSEAQITELGRTYSIHMLKNGRMAIVGITTKNIDYVARSIRSVIDTVK